MHSNHAVLTLQAEARTVQGWLHHNHPELYMTSSGTNITIFKEMGLPVDVVSRFGIRDMRGSHALGHTRMATESAVTTSASHPFSTGADLCLVHNGSMSNHNRMRRTLQFHGVEFQTENDTEVAAGYLTWRLQEGDTLDEALERGFEELDGFYTFAVGTHDGFAVVKDPIGAKPAILAETDDWVAMASEFRAIATLPGVENAKIWEPEPARVYSWYKS
jgi:glutamate synthase domain-containing protein 1